MTKLVALADAEVGLECIDWLLKTYPDDLALVGVTAENAIAARARAAGVPVELFTDSAAMAAAIRARGIVSDIGLLLWWPTILKDPLLSLPRQGFVNTHPSLLPWNRGKHYSFWAIVEGSPFGVTLHFADSGVDTGDIVAQTRIPVDWTDTGETLFHKARAAMIALVKQTYPTLRGTNIPRRAQTLQEGSFHKSADIAEASRINLDSQVVTRDLLNLLRAKTFAGLTGCTFEEDGRTFEVSVSIKEKT